MLVLDTSAALAALAANDPVAGLAERIAEDGDLHAPHLLDTELLHALRHMTLRGELSEERAADTLTDFAELAIVRYPHRPFNDRVWELRHNLTAYGATFVVLAETLDAPLLTLDARLAHASGVRAKIELFAPSQPG